MQGNVGEIIAVEIAEVRFLITSPLRSLKHVGTTALNVSFVLLSALGSAAIIGCVDDVFSPALGLIILKTVYGS